MKNRIFFIFFILLQFGQYVYSQDTTYARTLMLTLGSPVYGGRGYVGNGNRKAADFIANQFIKDGLSHYGLDYLQRFNFPINTIQYVDNIIVDEDTLVAGTDFYIANASQTTKGNYKLLEINDSLFRLNNKYRNSILNIKNSNKYFLVFHHSNRNIRFALNNKVAGLIFLHSKQLPPWEFSHAQNPVNYAIVDIIAERFPSNSTSITLDFTSKFYSHFPTRNVVAFKKGSLYPDSFLVIGAHYDHMGKMGQSVIFPGGNDNLSGTAMLLNLARYFSQHPQKYSLVFISFSGEEVGLLGSTYFVNHPLIDLKKIKFMLNIDMVGTGSKGIVVVNGSIFKNKFKLMTAINAKENYLPKVKVRGEACNSDHCPFYRKGVPSFFIYTTGDEYREYHSPMDLPQSVPLTNYNGVFRLIRDFIQQQ